jgi:glycosyltransferase involved in cell wall biosynthesis
MKILYVSAIELDCDGGPTTHVAEMIRQWHRLGHDVLLLTPPFSRTFAGLPDRVRHYPFAGYSVSRRLVSYPCLFVLLAWHLARFRPDVVYERQMEYNPFVFWACRLMRVPLFVELNGLIVEDLRQTHAPASAIRAHEMVESRELSFSTGITCTSARLQKKICARGAALCRKTKAVPNGVNRELFRPMERAVCRQKMGLDARLKVIGYVGTFSHLHQPEQAVRSFARVRKEIQDARLLMVGDGSRRKGCEHLAQNLGVASHVIFTGPLPYEKVPIAINCMDVGLALASRERLEREGVVAFKFQEMLACGCPVVAQFLEPEESARYSGVAKMVPVGDEAALDRALLELLGHPAEAARIAERALHYTGEHVSWEKSAQLSIDFMNYMITKGPVADE